MKLFHSLTFRVLGGSFILLIVLVGLYSYFGVLLQSDQMMELVLQAANTMSDVIKNSTHYSMLLNRKEDVYQIITMIGKEPGVAGIRIYNKRGEIMFSTKKSEEQTVVDMHAEACYVCHEQKKPLQSLPMNNRMRIYNSANGSRILGLINPIRNEPACSGGDCHAHSAEKTVLGVLDVRMSLEQVDKEIRQAQFKMILYSLITVIALSFTSMLFLYLTVHRPVKRLIQGTREISSGNLEHQIPIGTLDEIGQLASSFNTMTESLRKVMDENRRWSQELEHRVQEKTYELKRIHAQILQIEKMASLGKLSATVAHELNNPLEGILTYAKLIAKRMRRVGPASGPTLEMLEELDLIVRETERCGNIVKNLLLFSRKQVGEIALIPVKQIIEKSSQLVQHHFQISNVQFRTIYTSEDITLMCDENQIEQALVALFVNAVESMREGGTLTVEVFKSGIGDYPHIRLTDTGAGIAAEDVPHIFEPFFTTKKEGAGLGLGLSVVYGIVERHGGKIEVHSEPGKGSTFTISFPPMQGPVKQVSPRES